MRLIQMSERTRIPVSSRPMVCAVVGGVQRSATSCQGQPLCPAHVPDTALHRFVSYHQIGFFFPTLFTGWQG